MLIETIHPRKGTETKADALKDVRRYETIHPRKGTETIGRQLIETEAE